MRALLLDTHVWIWLMEGLPDLKQPHLEIINKAAGESMVWIAAISLWEIGMLSRKGRIRLEKPILSWINESLSLPGIQLQALTPLIAVESCQLPDEFHGDPADRLIVATARVNDLILITRDEKIVEYGKKEYISVIPV